MATPGETAAQVHRQVFAQRGEAGMHLGRDGARLSAQLRVLGPEAGLREALGEVLADCQTVPDGQVAMLKSGHTAARRMGPNRGLGLRKVQGDHDLVVVGAAGL